MLRFLRWLRRYWYVPLVLFAGTLGFIFGRRRENPVERVKSEVRAIKAETETKKLEALAGKESAIRAVEHTYRYTMRELDEKRKNQAEELRDDPAKLAKFLVRASNGSGKR